MPFFPGEMKSCSADTDCGNRGPESERPAGAAAIRDLDPDTAKSLIGALMALPDPRNARGFLRDSLLEGLLFQVIDRKQERADLYDRIHEEAR